ncbi:SDR family oxidoreductase [Streptomyces sp. NPDC047853]|uniref:SDR family oxidoreductase n=1 Tax=unclassified Streptomyces TaxID=2593676 RepID=UPI0034512755
MPGSAAHIVEEFLVELFGLRLQRTVESLVDLLDAGDRKVESMPLPGGVFEAAPVAVLPVGLGPRQGGASERLAAHQTPPPTSASCATAPRDPVRRPPAAGYSSGGSALRNGTSNVPYATSKAALFQECRSVAVDYGRQGVRANIVCPSWVRSEMADRRMTRFAEEADLEGGGAGAAYEEVTRLLPLGRPGEPREIAEAFDFTSPLAAASSPTDHHRPAPKLPVLCLEPADRSDAESQKSHDRKEHADHRSSVHRSEHVRLPHQCPQPLPGLTRASAWDDHDMPSGHLGVGRRSLEALLSKPES